MSKHLPQTDMAPAPPSDGAVRARAPGTLHVRLLNLGHLYDHWFILIYATAVIAMMRHFDLSYGEMMALSTAGFVAVGVGAVPAGWLGDLWGRRAMMLVFFFGLGASSVWVGLSRTPFEIALSLTAVGMFAAIYHPVAIAMISEDGPAGQIGRRLGVNGVWGNMGVAGAAIVTGMFVDLAGWRSAFIVPGVISMATGVVYWHASRNYVERARSKPAGAADADTVPMEGWQRMLLVVATMTMASAVIFNGITIAMPMVFQERIMTIVQTATGIGAVASAIYAVAAFSQMVVGRAIDKYSSRPLLSFLAIGQLVTLAIASFADGWLLIATSLVMMAMVFGQVPVAATLIARFMPSAIRARVYGVQYLITFGVGALAVPLISILHGTAGFSAFFIAMAALALFILAVAQALPADRRAQS